MRRILRIYLLWYGVGLVACCEPELTSDIELKGRDAVSYQSEWKVVTQLMALQFGVQHDDIKNAIQSVHTLTDSSYALNTMLSTNMSAQEFGEPLFDDVDLTYTKDSLGLTWNEIRYQIDCVKKPIVYSYGKQQTIGHMMIIIGYTNIGGTNYLHVYDPEQPSKSAERYISYEEYYEPIGRNTRWTTWYDFKHK